MVPYGGCMSAQPGEPQPGHDVIRVGTSEAVIEAVSQAHERWVAAGRPGARSHDEVMSELLAPSGGWLPPARP
jgi:hypothetical protein